MRLRLSLLLAWLMIAVSSAAGAADSDEVDLQGDVKNICTVLKHATTAAVASEELVSEKAAQLAANRELLGAWAVVFADLQNQTGLGLQDLDAAQLASAMAEIEAAVPAPAAAEDAADGESAEDAEEEEGWTAYDISRTALSVASIADPTGVVGVAAAYTYPKCGSEEARKSSGGFCWKDSYGRGVGSLPAGFGRVADCPAGYTNNGLTCGRGADNRSAPSRVADCPDDYTNMGLTCFRPASTYGQGSRVADCPADFTNMGASCYRWWPPKSLGMDSMTCSPGEFRSGGRCYKDCRPGYTNMGEFCARGADSKGADAMTCPSGYFLNGALGRCYQNCPAGYTNTSEFCFRGVSTLGLDSMSCRPGEFFKTGRCYDKATTCGPGSEFDGIGLCYPKCNEGFSGIGPVCWGACTGKLNVECAAGCADSAAACGLATTDMIASPLEMVASIATLGGYSSAKSSRKAAMVAAKETTTAALKQGVRKVASATGRKLDDILAAAAKAAGGDAAEAAARALTRQMLKNAKLGVLRTKRAAAYIKDNYVLVRQKVLDTVYTPVIEKAKAAGSAVWTKVKTAMSKPKKPLEGWEFDESINPGLGDLAKALFEEFQKARTVVNQNAALRAERLARACTKAGLTIDKAALE